MKPSSSLPLLALLVGAALPALAQNCGSGGGATVCLSASGTASNVQLNWTATGTIKSLEIYRDTDADPTGRSRIATVDKAATSYTDSTATTGTPY
jgi:hypothetical protein